MNKLFIFCAMAALSASQPSWAREEPKKIAIIKADDIRCPTEKWDRFFTTSEGKGIKVSAGIICESLQDEKQDYVDWLRKLQATGMVEFWNHGWVHKRWTNEDGGKISEFSGTDYDYQKEHIADAQTLMEKVLGAPPVTFGSPYNKTDSTTARVLNKDSNLRLFFCYPGEENGLQDKTLALMNLRGEYDGTGKPNFEKFKEKYLESDELSFTALQFHPNSFGDEHFAEYVKIIDFLIAEGWTIMLPSEYISFLDQTKSPSS